MSGHRQAAAALYALDDRDQGLILAELPADDQAILRNYLAELADLGFARAANSDAPPPRAADPAGRLMAASAPSMLAILGQEPATLVAQVLALECWPWTAQFLELLPPHRRALVREASNAGVTAAPARDSFLIEAMDAALSRMPVIDAPAGLGRVSALVARWNPWTR